MRPLRLELEGFMSFRQRTVVDFTDADLFVLVGPMGAGKSSIIDAMGFALYGSIARFENLNLVAPVISQGYNETKVQLDFRIGQRDYTAVRVARRSKTGGVTAPEARLSSGDQLLAGDPAAVTREVTDLLGLSFEQFTKCVVLPQGAFAELLHAKPSERQDLLVRLLDIGMYSKVGARSGRRRDRAKDTAELLQRRIADELAGATPEAYEERQNWVVTYGELYGRFQAEEETLAGLRKAAEGHRAELQEAESALRRLKAIVVPAGIGDLGERVRLAQQGYEAARESAAEAAAALTRLQEERQALGERTAVEAAIALYAQAERLREAVAGGKAQLEAAEVRLAEADRCFEEAEAARDSAIADRDRLQRAHSAFHASRGLKAGDVCPVCGEKLIAPPALEEPPGLREAEQAANAADKAMRAAEAHQKAAASDRHRAELALDNAETALKDAVGVLEQQPSLEDCAVILKRIDEAEAALVAARTCEREARVAVGAAEANLAQFRREEATALTAFHAARDPVASLGAPPATDDIEECWQRLSAWAGSRWQEEQERLAVIRRAEEEARLQAEGLVKAQTWACEAADIELRGKTPRDASLQAYTRAEAELKSLDQRLAERASVERDLAENVETSRVAGLLATHLRSDHFERWYLLEAMTRLVRGATDRLQELSNDQYALGINKQGTEFVVVDKINANEERPVRTLSGGETFLASLALALALGDEVAALAAQGAARLDALFLDEGFGSLDPNTLETVASTIEELGARGRMVGIVTHVPELADRIPIQFKVSKVAGSSCIERVEKT